MNENSHFFLSAAGESKELANPRECWEIKRMRDAFRNDYMLISMEPPYREPRGMGYRDVYKLLIATRFKGLSLYPITSWPCHVSVFLLPASHTDIEEEIESSQLRNVAWAMLFRTFPEANAHFNKFS